MNRARLTVFLPAVFLVLAILFTGSGMESLLIDQKVEAIDVPAPPTPQKTEETLVITAVGDIMMHDLQIKAGWQSWKNKYDFSGFFTRVKPLLDASDLVIGNLETPLAGKTTGYSGYPCFNAPEALAGNLKDAGFDILTTANNHCLDQGRQGLKSTLNFLDQTGLLHTGTARSLAEQQKILITEIKDIKLAVLAYTYGTNGLAPSKSYRYTVNYIDASSIKKDISRAKELGAQLIIVSLHFGQEYQTTPDAEQEGLAQSLLASGADIILGSHPHVLQPAYWLPSNTGGDFSGESPGKFAIYSLGNFISAQDGLERNSSILLNLYIGVDDSGKAHLRKARFIPIATRRYKQNGVTNFEVMPVEPALTSLQTGQILGVNSTLTFADYTFLRDSWNLATKRLQSGDASFGLLNLPMPLNGLPYITSLKQE